MTTDDIKALITAGDPGTAWAATEQFITQQIDLALADQKSKSDAVLADKDAAHEATIARLTAEHQSALTSQKIASDTATEVEAKNAADALSKAMADADAKLAETLRTSAESMDVRVKLDDAKLAAQKETADDAIGALKDALAETQKQRDDLTSKLVDLSARQAQLAMEARQHTASLRSALQSVGVELEKIEAVSDAANQTADERAAEERARRLVEAEAVVASLKGTNI